MEYLHGKTIGIGMEPNGKVYYRDPILIFLRLGYFFFNYKLINHTLISIKYSEKNKNDMKV